MSGTPNGFDDFRPLNSHGRDMPKTVRPMPRDGKAPEVDLYQLWVETKTGRTLAVGPRAPRPFLEMMLTAMNAQIALGKEQSWSNPHLMPAS